MFTLDDYNKRQQQTQINDDRDRAEKSPKLLIIEVADIRMEPRARLSTLPLLCG